MDSLGVAVLTLDWALSVRSCDFDLSVRMWFYQLHVRRGVFPPTLKFLWLSFLNFWAWTGGTERHDGQLHSVIRPSIGRTYNYVKALKRLPAVKCDCFFSRKTDNSATWPWTYEEQHEPDPGQQQTDDHVWTRKDEPRSEVDTILRTVHSTTRVHWASDFARKCSMHCYNAYANDVYKGTSYIPIWKYMYLLRIKCSTIKYIIPIRQTNKNKLYNRLKSKQFDWKKWVK